MCAAASMARPFLAGLALTVLLSGCLGGTTHTDGTHTLAAGDVFELNLDLDGALRWNWTASAPISFNVHSHTDEGVVDHVMRTGASGQGTFEPPGPGKYSVMWGNPGPQPASLRYDVTLKGRIV